MTDDTKTVDVLAEVPFREFNVPNFAQITDGENNLSVAVSRLSPAALDQLVGVWLERVYAKCNRDMPWILP
jgi:hypothetical protein